MWSWLGFAATSLIYVVCYSSLAGMAGVTSLQSIGMQTCDFMSMRRTSVPTCASASLQHCHQGYNCRQFMYPSLVMPSGEVPPYAQ